MESDLSEIEDLLILATTMSFMTKKKKRPRRFRVNPYLQLRPFKGRFHKDVSWKIIEKNACAYMYNFKVNNNQFQDMVNYPEAFRENFHMEPQVFEDIHRLIVHRLQPKYKARPDSLSSREKLAITLEYGHTQLSFKENFRKQVKFLLFCLKRFLASGSLQRHIASVYRTSKQVVGPVIDSTCEAIYEVLLPLSVKVLYQLQQL